MPCLQGGGGVNIANMSLKKSYTENHDIPAVCPPGAVGLLCALVVEYEVMSKENS